MPLPDFIIGGAQKSGTTFLHALLQSHRDVFIPRRPQEIHYFDLDDNFARGRKWFESLFADWSGQAHIGQTSPMYLYEPRAPERIAAVIPDARLIFVVRNPVDRAHAHYWHEVKKGWEDLGFEEALRLEPERIAGGGSARRHFSYADRGRYAPQLRRFLECFPSENLLVLLHEELGADPQRLAERCADFLGIDPGGFSNAAAPRNAARLPRVRFVQRATRSIRERAPLAGRLVDALNLKTAPYPQLEAGLRQRLLESFEPDVRATEEVLGTRLDSWRR